MKNFLLVLAIAGGGYWWWTHRAPQPAADATPARAEPAAAAQNKSVIVGVPAKMTPTPQASTGSSWPRRQIDRAQAAANAAKAQHDGL